MAITMQPARIGTSPFGGTTRSDESPEQRRKREEREAAQREAERNRRFSEAEIKFRTRTGQESQESAQKFKADQAAQDRTASLLTAGLSARRPLTREALSMLQSGGGGASGGPQSDALRLNARLRAEQQDRFAKGAAYNRQKGAADQANRAQNIQTYLAAKQAVQDALKTEDPADDVAARGKMLMAESRLPSITYQGVGGQEHVYNPKIASRLTLPVSGQVIHGLAQSDQERANFAEDKARGAMEGLRAETSVAQKGADEAATRVRGLAALRRGLNTEYAQARRQSPGAEAIAGAGGQVGEQLMPTVWQNLDRDRQFSGDGNAATTGYTAANAWMGRAQGQAQDEMNAAMGRVAQLYSPETYTQTVNQSQQNLPMVVPTAENIADVGAKMAAPMGQLVQSGAPGAPMRINPEAMGVFQQRGAQLAQMGAMAGMPGPYEQILANYQAQQPPAQPAPTGAPAQPAPAAPAPMQPPIPPLPFPTAGAPGSPSRIPSGELLGKYENTAAEEGALAAARAREIKAMAEAAAIREATDKSKSGAGETTLSKEDQETITTEAGALRDIGDYAPPDAQERVTPPGAAGWVARNIPFTDAADAALFGRPLMTERVAALPETMRAYLAEIDQKMKTAANMNRKGAVQAMSSAIKGTESYKNLPMSVRAKVNLHLAKYTTGAS